MLKRDLIISLRGTTNQHRVGSLVPINSRLAPMKVYTLGKADPEKQALAYADITQPQSAAQLKCLIISLQYQLDQRSTEERRC